MNVDLFSLKDVLCSCGNNFFQSVIVIKEVPAVISPNGQEMEYAVQLLRCTSCGDVRYPNGGEIQEESFLVK